MCGEIDAEEEETDNTPPDEELDHLISIDDLEYKEADFLVEGLLERDSLVAVFGESGAGKSFFVIDLLASISAGIDFHGRPVQQAPCIYIAGEGKRGIIKRNKAWNIGRWATPDGKKPFYPVRMGNIFSR
jgi:RecA-family ATPase